MREAARGLTLIEAMVTIAILAILAAVGLPSYNALMAGSRVEGVATNLQADLQLARSTATLNNENITVAFGSNCYVIYRSSATSASCTAVSPSTALIKSVSLNSGDKVTLSLSTGFTSTTFNPERGTVNSTGNVTAEIGSAKLRVELGVTGRVKLCAPSGSTMGGYGTC